MRHATTGCESHWIQACGLSPSVAGNKGDNSAVGSRVLGFRGSLLLLVLFSLLVPEIVGSKHAVPPLVRQATEVARVTCPVKTFTSALYLSNGNKSAAQVGAAASGKSQGGGEGEWPCDVARGKRVQGEGV
jgi:hypothetical protein